MLICFDPTTQQGCGTRHPQVTRFCPQCGQNLARALSVHDRGALIGPYQVDDLIGYGGFGVVYLAQDTQHQPSRLVALKEVFDARRIQSLRDEFSVLQQLSHPHLPAYYDVFEHQGYGYLVMEYVPGQSLADVLRQQAGPLLESQVLGYAIQLCDALSYLHSQQPPIIHRDIKPANIRITPAGLIKLVDFGLLKQGGGVTRDSRRAVTPGYAPLEQYAGGGSTDARTDLYSLGATLYQLLTGVDPEDALDRVSRSPDPLRPPQTLNGAISSHVNAALLAALALHAPDRPSEVALFKRELLGNGSVASVGGVNPPLAAPPLPAAPGQQLPPSPPPGVVPGRALPLPVPLQHHPFAGLMAIVVVGLLVVTLAIAAAVPNRFGATEGVDQTLAPLPVPAFVHVPAGPFLMGSSTVDTMAFDGEKPQHTLTLPDYWIGKTEVTNAQFRPFVEGDGYMNRAYWTEVGWQWREQNGILQPAYWGDSRLNGDNQPVVGVSWFEAVAYCRWLSAQTGHEFRLPSEAEWEKAARGPDGRIWPWGSVWDAAKLHSGQATGRTTAVGQYPAGASPYGAQDMAGNVSEWTATEWGKSYPYRVEDEWSLAYLSGETSRMLRGGLWYSTQQYTRGAFRFSYHFPSNRLIYFGLRIATPSPVPGSGS